jgi:hypothetical protein
MFRCIYLVVLVVPTNTISSATCSNLQLQLSLTSLCPSFFPTAYEACLLDTSWSLCAAPEPCRRREHIWLATIRVRDSVDHVYAADVDRGVYCPWGLSLVV